MILPQPYPLMIDHAGGPLLVLALLLVNEGGMGPVRLTAAITAHGQIPINEDTVFIQVPS